MGILNRFVDHEVAPLAVLEIVREETRKSPLSRGARKIDVPQSAHGVFALPPGAPGNRDSCSVLADTGSITSCPL